MGNLANILMTLVLLLFFIFTTPSTAYIKSYKIRSDDNLIDFDQFEFSRTGHVSIAISSVSVTSMSVTSNVSRPDPSRFGFFLCSDHAFDYIDSESFSCFLDSKYISLLFTFKALSSQSSFHKTYNVTYPNWYTLKFANCNPLTHVTMDVRTELYNTINGDTKDYLSAGETNFPRYYFILSLIYLCCIGLWIFVCFMNRNSSLHWIHLLMGVLLLMKGLNLLFASKVEYFLKVTGTRPHRWNILLYVFQYIRTVLFYTVSAVIIDGCCFLNPEIPVTIGLIIVIPVQIFSTIASKSLREVIVQDSVGWQVGLVFAECICRVVFIVLVGFGVCNTSKNDTLVKNHLGKFTLIRVFNVVFIVYLLIDLVCEVIGRDWAKASETASLVMYMVMYLVFMPSQKTKYFIPHTPVAPVPEVELGC